MPPGLNQTSSNWAAKWLPFKKSDPPAPPAKPEVYLVSTKKVRLPDGSKEQRVMAQISQPGKRSPLLPERLMTMPAEQAQGTVFESHGYRRPKPKDPPPSVPLPFNKDEVLQYHALAGGNPQAANLHKLTGPELARVMQTADFFGDTKTMNAVTPLLVRRPPHEIRKAIDQIRTWDQGRLSDPKMQEARFTQMNNGFDFPWYRFGKEAVLKDAVGRDYADATRLIAEKNPTLGKQSAGMVDHACREKKWDAAKVLVEHDFPIYPMHDLDHILSPSFEVAKHGPTDLLKSMHEKLDAWAQKGKDPQDTYTRGSFVRSHLESGLIGAAKHGNLDNMRYLFTHDTFRTLAGARNSQAVLEAANHGQADAVRLLHQSGANVGAQNNRAVRDAAGRGDMPMLRCLGECNAVLNDPEAIRAASENGHRDVASFLSRAPQPAGQ